MDRFVPKTDNGKGSAQSYFEVKRMKNVTMQAVSDAAIEEFKQHHSDVTVTDKDDTTNYMLNPLEGIHIQAYDSDPKSAKGEQYSYLSPVNPIKVNPQEPIPIGILSIGHFYNKDIEKMAEDIINQGGRGDRKRMPSDISLKSIMIEDKNDTKSYLIEDGQGGIFQLHIMVAPNEDTKKLLNSLRIVPLRGNEELMKSEELQPTAG